jgi:protein-disulfide isomerase
MLTIPVTQLRPVEGRPCHAGDPGAPFPAVRQQDLAMTRPGCVLGLSAIIALSIVSAASAAAPAGSPGTPDAASAEPAREALFNILGTEDAPVAIVEFSDLQCPYCARYALQTFPEIKRTYIDTGKVHYAAIDFPLPMHAYAFPAAVAARCAGEQGKYWQYRQGIFAAQSQLASDSFDALATKLGLDVGKFDSCRRDVRQDAKVREDLAMARHDGIDSTPSFMIGRVVDGEFQGEVISGAKSFEEFSKRIEKLLSAGK